MVMQGNESSSFQHSKKGQKFLSPKENFIPKPIILQIGFKVYLIGHGENLWEDGRKSCNFLS